jgi:chaperonin GroEL (HSP60 family)
MSSRNSEEIWRQLVEEAGADEIERAASVSVAEAEKELAEAGFDAAAERTMARALHDDLQAGRPVSG